MTHNFSWEAAKGKRRQDRAGSNDIASDVLLSQLCCNALGQSSDCSLHKLVSANTALIEMSGTHSQSLSSALRDYHVNLLLLLPTQTFEQETNF